MGFGFANHTLDFIVRKAAGGLNADRLLFSGCFVLGVHADDAVGINVEGDFNLRYTPGRGGNPHKVELAERLIVRGHFALALENTNRNRSLIVVRSREDLALLRWNRRIALNEPSEHTAESFDAERERRYVQKQNVLHFALQHACLNGSADGNDLVGVDALMRLASEELFYGLLHFRHARHAADKNDFVDLVRRNTCILQRLFHRRKRTLNEFIH